MCGQHVDDGVVQISKKSGKPHEWRVLRCFGSYGRSGSNLVYSEHVQPRDPLLEVYTSRVCLSDVKGWQAMFCSFSLYSSDHVMYS
jgi:hypothetical protein